MNASGVWGRIHGKSLRHVFAFLRAQAMVGQILKTVDLQAFKVYQERYKDADPPPGGYSKYLDIRTWMAAKLTYIYFLELQKSEPLRILDLGTGPGYFPYLCSLFGHQVIALDLDIIPMYNEVCKFFRVDRKTWRVGRFERLPEFGVKFDLVTAFMIKFNQHDRPDQWAVEEWRFFVEDLERNQLREDGRIFLDFNVCSDGTWFSDDVRNLFLNFGGKIYRNHVDMGGSLPNSALMFLDRLLAGKKMYP